MHGIRGGLGAATALISVVAFAKIMAGDYNGAISCIAAICVMVSILIRKVK